MEPKKSPICKGKASLKKNTSIIVFHVHFPYLHTSEPWETCWNLQVASDPDFFDAIAAVVSEENGLLKVVTSCDDGARHPTAPCDANKNRWGKKLGYTYSTPPQIQHGTWKSFGVQVRNLLFQGSIFRFHVFFWGGCNWNIDGTIVTHWFIRTL